MATETRFPLALQDPRIQSIKLAQGQHKSSVLDVLRPEHEGFIHNETKKLFTPFVDKPPQQMQDPRIDLLQNISVFDSRFTYQEALQNMLLDLDGNGDWKRLFIQTLEKGRAGDMVDVYFLSAMRGLVTNISMQFNREIKNNEYPGFKQFKSELEGNDRHNEFMIAMEHVRSLMDDCIRTTPDSYKKRIHTINAPIDISSTNKSPREYLEPSAQRELDLILVARILHDYEEGIPADFPDIEEGFEPRTKAVQYYARWSTMLDWAEKQLKEEGDLLQLFLRAVQNKNTRLQEEVPPAA